MKVNLDWAKIDNDKVFQRLSSHLFLMEVNRTYFIPSSPYIGADGGWDGRYDGEYQEQTGVFSIQAKWTLKNFNDSEAYFKRELPKEIKKAESQNVDHLILTTNAKLRVEHVTNLQKLKPDTLKSLQVWHRESLTLKLYEHPFLCFFYFDNPQLPAFRPPEDYFSDDKENLFLSSCLGRSDEIGNLFHEITRNENSIFIRHAPGGHGKTHYLHEVAVKLDQSIQDSQIWCINPNLRPLQDAFQDELVSGRNYILILDDADRYLEDLRHLVGLIQATDKVKLVLGCRSAGLPLIEQEIYKQRITQFSSKELAPLNDSDLIKLLGIVSGKEEIERVDELIEHLDKMPYLIVQYGKRLRGEIGEIDIKNIHTTLTRLVADDAKDLLITILPNPTNAEYLLTHIAAIVPFHETDSNLSILSEAIDQPPNVVSQCIQLLITGKILRYIGRSIRFYPDMAGDLFLAGKINSENKITEQLLTTWFSHLPEQVISNIASAVTYDESQSVKRVLSDLVHTWIREAELEPKYHHIGKLDWLERIIRFVPEDGLNLMYTYMELHKENPEKYHSPHLDNYGPLLNILGELEHFNIEAITFIKKAKELKLGNTYANYKSSSIIYRMVRPSKIPMPLIEAVIFKIVCLIESDDVSAVDVEIAIDVATELLAGTHEWTYSTPRGITIGARPLRDIPEVHNLRDSGIQIFKTLLCKEQYIKAALAIAEHIGDRSHSIGQQDLPLSQRIDNDRVVVLEELGKLKIDQLPIPILSELEDLLMNWWLGDKGGTEAALDIIKRLPKTSLYLFYRHYIPSRYIVYDIDDVLDMIDHDDKWKWWVQNKSIKAWDNDDDGLMIVATQLSSTYDTIEKLEEFYLEADSLISQINNPHNPIILRHWVDLNPDLFLSYIDQKKLDNTPDIFRLHILANITKYRTDLIKEKCKEIEKKASNLTLEDYYEFYHMILNNDVEDSDIEPCFYAIKSKGDLELRGEFIRSLYSYYLKNNDPDSYARITIDCIHGNLSKDFIDRLASAIHALKNTQSWSFSNEELLEEMRAKIRPLLPGLEEIDYPGDEIVKFCFGRNISMYIDLIEQRLQYYSELQDSQDEYEEIPHDGFTGLADATTSQSDFNSLISKILQWKVDFPDSQYRIRKILESVIGLKDENKKPRISVWILGELKKETQEAFDDIITIIGMGDFYHFNDATILNFITVGHKIGSFEKAKKAFQPLLYLGSVSSTVGEIPSAYDDKKKFCERSMELALRGPVKAFFQEQVDFMDGMIKDHLDEMAEYLNQK